LKSKFEEITREPFKASTSFGSFRSARVPQMRAALPSSSGQYHQVRWYRRKFLSTWNRRSRVTLILHIDWPGTAGWAFFRSFAQQHTTI